MEWSEREFWRDVRWVDYGWVFSCIGDLAVYVIRVRFVYVEGDGMGFLSSELGDYLPECVCNLQVISSAKVFSLATRYMLSLCLEMLGCLFRKG